MILSILQKFCDHHGYDRQYWVGYSGGLDSHVLLHALSRIQTEKPLKLRAIHIHHGLSPYADHWLSHCFEQCRKLHIELYSREIKIDLSRSSSLEERAREKRYEQLISFLEKDDLLITAHHQDDQAETVLLQLLRGAGPKGLAAMPQLRRLCKGLHARPLLNITRRDLQHYAEKHALQWINDESNQNNQLTRNFLRLDILPLLKKRWPGLTATLARVAENCSDAQHILDDVLKEELQVVRGETSQTLSVTRLLGYSSSKQKLLLRAWLYELQVQMPSSAKLEAIQTECLLAREDKRPVVKWKIFEVRRFRNELYAIHIPPTIDTQKIYEWDIKTELKIPDLGIIRTVRSRGLGVRLSGKISIRFRQGGEKIFLRGCHHTLKNLFHEWKVPYWQRARIPLLYIGSELAAVPGFCVSDHYQLNPEEAGYNLQISYFSY